MIFINIFPAYFCTNSKHIFLFTVAVLMCFRVCRYLKFNFKDKAY